MVPPHPTATTLDSGAPLSKWRVYETFDTAVTCDTAQASEEQDWKSKADADPNNAVTKFLVKSWLASQCIGADDLLFLCSEQARFIVGHLLVVDGGWTAR
jgi:NAD(P)-dependent dehydrogenase (short-subunit alcohol dehydrogenase family)